MPVDFKSFARTGAAMRLQELETERAVILKTFPVLGARMAPAPAPKRRKMSAAGKAAIRAGVKKRWAEWRKRKGSSN